MFSKKTWFVTDPAIAPGAFSVDFFRAEVGWQTLGSEMAWKIPWKILWFPVKIIPPIHWRSHPAGIFRVSFEIFWEKMFFCLTKCCGTGKTQHVDMSLQKVPQRMFEPLPDFFLNTESSFCFGWISVLDIWYCFFLKGMFVLGGLDTIYIARFLMFLWTPGEKKMCFFFNVSAVNKSIFVVKSSFYPVQSPLSIAILCHTVN